MTEPIAEPTIEPAPDAAAEPAEPAWAPSQDEWQQISQAVQSLAQIEQQRAAVYQPPTQGGPPMPDPWNRPDTYQQDLDAYISARMAPVQQFTQEAALAEAEERAQDILGDLVSKHGEFDRELAYARANTVLPAMVNRYGSGPKAAEAALEEGARLQREYEQKVRGEAVSQYTNQIKTLSGAPGEPGSQYQVGVQQRTMPDYRKDGGSVTDRFFKRGD